MSVKRCFRWSGGWNFRVKEPARQGVSLFRCFGGLVVSVSPCWGTIAEREITRNNKKLREIVRIISPLARVHPKHSTPDPPSGVGDARGLGGIAGWADILGSGQMITYSNAPGFTNVFYRGKVNLAT